MGLGLGREVSLRSSLPCCPGVALSRASCSLPPLPCIYRFVEPQLLLRNL